jgi:hypothetical protein
LAEDQRSEDDEVLRPLTRPESAKQAVDGGVRSS